MSERLKFERVDWDYEPMSEKITLRVEEAEAENYSSIWQLLNHSHVRVDISVLRDIIDRIDSGERHGCWEEEY